MKNSTSKLTNKQKRFCEEYMVNLNATQAAIRAGYSQKTAREQAARLLSKVNIQEKIYELQLESRKQTNITKEEILVELAAMVRSKITDYLSFDGEKIKWKSFDELTEVQIKAIEGIRQTRHGIEIRLHGKAWSTERISKMLGYDDPKDIRLMLDRLDESALDAIIERILSKK